QCDLRPLDSDRPVRPLAVRRGRLDLARARRAPAQGRAHRRRARRAARTRSVPRHRPPRPPAPRARRGSAWRAGADSLGRGRAVRRGPMAHDAALERRPDRLRLQLRGRAGLADERNGDLPMRYAAACAALTLWSSSALAGEVRQVPHGMEVTTDAGEIVRVLAYADGTFRVTAAETLPAGRPTAMVVAEPDGEPQFSATAEAATLRTAHSVATVVLDDGRLTVHDAAGTLLLDEYAPARRLTPVTLEGQPWLAIRVQFNRGTDEGLFGLGQHQNRQMNYNGEDVELAQHNMAIAIPYLVSTRGYGILWDNASITRVGNPEPYGKLEAGWEADYYLGEQLVLSRPEQTIDYQYIRDQSRWPEKAKAATEAATTGQNTAGNAVQTQRVVWNGSYSPAAGGTHKFRLYSSSYVKVFADGKEVLSRWRQNWNPWYHNFELDLEAGEPVELTIEWEPNQGYI